MRLLWISARVFGKDMAGTMETGLLSALNENGVDITLISPGEFSDSAVSQIEVKMLSFPGLKTLSGARYIRSFLKNELQSHPDVIMIDWRYVYSLRNFLNSSLVPWFIVDRGPPANRGFLKKLQKWFWKKGWIVAGNNSCGGFVVSEMHKSFVKNLTNVNLNIKILPAGANKNNYSLTKSDPKELLKLVYVGTIDSRRGVKKIFKLCSNLEKNLIKYNLIICGEGDLNKDFNYLSSLRDNFIFYGQTPHNEVIKLLSQSHIGIMPMPDMPIWRIASPLKLMEYLSAGLLIAGPKHSGNQIRESGPWNLLSDEDWTEDTIYKINKLSSEDWIRFSESAINESKKYLWPNIAKKFIQDIENLIDL